MLGLESELGLVMVSDLALAWGFRRRRIGNVFRVRDLEDAALRVVEQKDLAIAVRVVSGLRLLCCYVTIRSEDDEAPIRADVARDGVEKSCRMRDLSGEWVRSRTGSLGRNGDKRATD